MHFNYQNEAFFNLEIILTMNNIKLTVWYQNFFRFSNKSLYFYNVTMLPTTTYLKNL
jgi:hypothetical protein